jgi:hypothetical protein
VVLKPLRENINKHLRSKPHLGGRRGWLGEQWKTGEHGKHGKHFH